MLAIIPARKGSKGLPSKALRTIGGIPAILRTLRTVEQSGVAQRIRVSTDCPEIQAFCELRGYSVIPRPDELARDDTPLYPVAAHAARVESWTGAVGIFQPTCPLLRAETLRGLVHDWEQSGEWAITATDDHHLHWYEGSPIGERANRQHRKPLKRESGAAQFMSARFLQTREGKQVLLSIPPREALDIDTPEDLLLAERLVSTARIRFVVAMGPDIGTGHFHRSLALARAFSHHDISWSWRGDPPDWAVGQVAGWPVIDAPDMTIFDCLSVPEDELLATRQRGKVVVLEDETQASRRYADLLVNDMLDLDDLRYAVLRSEFLCLPEVDQVEHGRRVLVTFGGSDPAGLTARCLRVLAGVPCEAQVLDGQVATEMRSADLVVTGQGRTVLEAAACSIPCISIASNEREARHIRLPGVTYLGLHTTVTDEALRHTVRSTLASKALRKEKAQAASTVIDGRGLDRLVRRIEDLLV